MYYHLIPVPICIVLIIHYFIIKNRQDLKANAIIQPVTTFVVIIVAALSFPSPKVNTAYTTWILIGLGLSFAADIFNIDMANDKILFAAIAVFTVAYLEYGITFTVFNGFHSQDIYTGIVLLASYVGVVAMYWPGLGSFKIPVLIYGLVMPFMVWRALSTFFGDAFTPTQAIMVSIGTAALYIGDIEYGYHRFRKPLNRIYGPLMYEGGQLLIALSCSYFALSS